MSATRIRRTTLFAALLLGTLAAPLAASSGALERALAVITEEKLRTDLTFIASDGLRGRDTPSRGLELAARFIRARLMRLGWEPGASPQEYFHEYEVPGYFAVGESCFAELTVAGETRRLVLGQDYFPSRYSINARDRTGAILWGRDFAGTNDDLGSFAGKWVLLEPGTRLSGRLRREAAQAGIHGFLISADPEAEESVQANAGPDVKRALQPRIGKPRSRYLPMIYLSEELTAGLLAGVDSPSVGTPLGANLREVLVVDEDPLVVENVCGLWTGSDPELRNEVIILSAHYDHVGARPNGDIYNGADDNGSGTCGLMAIAEALRAYGPMRRTVLLLWVSGEEKGLLGSRAWANDPWLPEGMRPICNINLDMIGRNAPDEIGITPTRKLRQYNRLTELVEENMRLEGFTKLNSADSYWSRSDHASFSKNLKIPVAFIFADVHGDYHKPTDTAEKIDYGKVKRVTRLVVRVLEGLQTDEIEF